MNREFWISKWKKGETGFHQDEINPYLKKFWPEIGLEKGRTVFVPLCGKSRDMSWLAGEGYPVLGVELSSLACEAFFSEKGLQPDCRKPGLFSRYHCGDISLLCGDLFDLTTDDLKDVRAVYDRASLIALPPDMRERYAAHLKKNLPQNVPMLLLTLSYGEGEMNGPPFSVTVDEVKKLYSDTFHVRNVLSRDIIEEEPLFKSRGLASLIEKVYLLVPLSSV
ncbi:MAG: thiopurine S-methyltransferase [Deltaproteobacteria bacterium]|nr:thiopurine S-methyltransferase [Deltaproteobacteria bacterium]